MQSGKLNRFPQQPRDTEALYYVNFVVQQDYGDSDVDDDVWTQPTQEEVATPRLILPNLREEKTDTEQNKVSLFLLKLSK